MIWATHETEPLVLSKAVSDDSSSVAALEGRGEGVATVVATIGRVATVPETDEGMEDKDDTNEDDVADDTKEEDGAEDGDDTNDEEDAAVDDPLAPESLDDAILAPLVDAADADAVEEASDVVEVAEAPETVNAELEAH